MTSWEREERQRQKDLEAVNSDRIKQYDRYWGDLNYNGAVFVSKDDEDAALLQDIKLLRVLMGR
jgi:hypothetical protein